MLLLVIPKQTSNGKCSTSDVELERKHYGTEKLFC